MTQPPLPDNYIESRKDPSGELRSRAINIRNVIPRYARCAIVTRLVRRASSRML